LRNLILLLWALLSVNGLVAQNPGELKWSYATGGEIYSSPALAIDGTLFIGVNDNVDDVVNANRIIALNSDGSLKWESSVGDWVDSSPAISVDGVLYIGCWDGFLYAFDCETGEELWKFETFGVIEASPAIGKDGVIYFGNGENMFYAVNPDGSPAWVNGNNSEASPLEFSDWVDSSATFDGQGNVWVADLFGNLSQIAPDKSVVWTVDLGAGIPISPAIAEDGTVYIGDEDGFVIAITPGNDTPKWFFNTGLEGIESSPVLGPDGTVYIGTGDDRVFAFDGQTGAVKSGWPFTEPGEVVYSSPAIAENGTIYIGSGDKNLYAISSSGQKLWSFPTGGFVDSSPAVGYDGTVYFGSTDGVVYAVHGDSSLSFSRWPRWRGSNESTGLIDPYRAWAEEQNLSDPDPFADGDNDELENVLEWAFCTDPKLAGLSDVKFPYSTFTSEGLQLKAGWIVSARGLGFDYSDDLVTWTSMNLKAPDNYPWYESMTQEPADEKTLVQLHLNAAESPPKFFRLTGKQH
jgi:outer membrane protein assembly factor BamB